VAFYPKKDNRIWLWLAINRDAPEQRELSFGSRNSASGRRLWEKIKDVEVGRYATDYLPTYTNFLPHKKHVQSKAQTHIIEGENSRIRHYLARLHRKTFCYSKSLEMVNISMLLLTYKDLVVDSMYLG
jgi:insertion element IS1 protein InsB